MSHRSPWLNVDLQPYGNSASPLPGNKDTRVIHALHARQKLKLDP